MAADHWPLLQRFAALQSLAPVALCQLPTPVQAVPGHTSLWVKRDDLTRADQGGNKPRKLEFVLADIRRRGANRVITLGATGTNAGVATALMCQREGLACEVITFPQPDSDIVSLNQRLMRNAGARLSARRRRWPECGTHLQRQGLRCRSGAGPPDTGTGAVLADLRPRSSLIRTCCAPCGAMNP